MAKPLNTSHAKILQMELKKVVMRDETEYRLLWDETLTDEIFYNMIDIRKGWVKLNKHDVSQVVSEGEFRAKKIGIAPQIRALISEQYGEFFD